MLFLSKKHLFLQRKRKNNLKTTIKHNLKQKNTMAETKETPKFDGISAQINLSPGSETHRRFAELMRETGAMTARSFVEILMDSYQSPHTDNSETIANLEQQIVDLKSENAAYDATNQNLELEISELKQQLQTAQNEANENAVNGLGKQAQLEEMKQQLEGAIIVKTNPVSRYFLEEMATKQQTTPGKILERLFMDDLQNPRANNLPYTVSGSRIREVMEELKGSAQ